MRICLIPVGLLLIAGMAFAADIDGKWEGEIQGMDGSPTKISYTFKADGTALTGSTVGPDGKEIQIQDGKIDGDKISFTLALDFGGNAMKLTMKGTVTGDQIKLTMDMGDAGGMGGPPMEFVLKKVK